MHFTKYRLLRILVNPIFDFSMYLCCKNLLRPILLTYQKTPIRFKNNKELAENPIKE